MEADKPSKEPCRCWISEVEESDAAGEIADVYARLREERGRVANILPRVNVNFAILTFNQILDRSKRERFNAMPTTFSLGRDDVDALIAESGTLLQHSPEYQEFLDKVGKPVLGASHVEPPASGR